MNESRVWANRMTSLRSSIITTTNRSLMRPTVIFSQFGRVTDLRRRRSLASAPRSSKACSYCHGVRVSTLNCARPPCSRTSWICSSTRSSAIASSITTPRVYAAGLARTTSSSSSTTIDAPGSTDSSDAVESSRSSSSFSSACRRCGRTRCTSASNRLTGDAPPNSLVTTGVIRSTTKNPTVTTTATPTMPNATKMRILGSMNSGIGSFSHNRGKMNDR